MSAGLVAGLGGLLLRGASLLLPSPDIARYRQEWLAEHAFVASTHGARESLLYAVRTLARAPQTSVSLRRDTHLAYLEASFATLALAVPAIFFAVYAIVSGQALLFVAQASLFIGLTAVALGIWRDDRAFFHSTLSRVGLVISVSAAVFVTVVNRLTDVTNPALEGPYRVLLPSLTAQLGLAVLFVGSRLGQGRAMAMQIGLGLTWIGSFCWAVVEIVNVVMIDSNSDRIFHLVSAPPMLLTAYASYVVLTRKEVVTQSVRNTTS